MAPSFDGYEEGLVHNYLRTNWIFYEILTMKKLSDAQAAISNTLDC